MFVLVTRPRFDAERTALKLAALGHQALIDPVIEIETLPFALPQKNYDALVFTSANGVRALPPKISAALLALPVFTVGGGTADAARERGFRQTESADGDVNALAALLAKRLARQSRVLHLAGEDRAGDLPGMLAAHDIHVDVLSVYKARARSALEAETVAAFAQKKIAVVLHYSPRSAEAFVKLAQAAGIREAMLQVRHLCISEAAAAPLRKHDAKIAIAAAPDETSLLALLA